MLIYELNIINKGIVLILHNDYYSAIYCYIQTIMFTYHNSFALPQHIFVICNAPKNIKFTVGLHNAVFLVQEWSIALHLVWNFQQGRKEESNRQHSSNMRRGATKDYITTQYSYTIQECRATFLSFFLSDFKMDSSCCRIFVEGKSKLLSHGTPLRNVFI